MRQSEAQTTDLIWTDLGSVFAETKSCNIAANTDEDFEGVLDAPISFSAAPTSAVDSDSEELLSTGKDSWEDEAESDAAPEFRKTAKRVIEGPGSPPREPPSRGNGAAQGRPLFDPQAVELELAPWIDGHFTVVGNLAASMYGDVRFLKATDGTGAVAKIMPTKKLLQMHAEAADEQVAWLEGGVARIEDPWHEIAVLTFLQQSAKQCTFLPKLLGVFEDQDSTYVVTEYCEGGELFERVACGNKMPPEQVRRYTSHLLRAVQHLHGHNLGHRDISLENILLRRDECVLMDFGQAVRLKTGGAELRYFARAGKTRYRAPEMYVPRKRSIQVTCPRGANPGDGAQVSYDCCRCEVLLPEDAIPGQLCDAEPRGYAAAPADIFACGVCAFVLAIGRPPWKIARDSDNDFSFIHQHGVPARLRRSRIRVDPSLEDLLDKMLGGSPKDRPSSEECLQNVFLASFRTAFTDGV